ncbi:response regulator [Roseateles sp.]|uniref:response regulator n=1 Tax=Roseateles sp. TaxID=1971397 RepID=UPI00286CA745|nr:response regulator [Roseateles sp.]
MTRELWHIVIIDDNPDDRAEARRLLLKGSDRRYAFTEAQTGADGLRALADWSTALHRCIVLDYNLPDMDAPEFLAAIRGSDGAPGWPVVVFTGADSTETGRIALRAGAHDYVGKGWLTPQVLVRAVENAAERWAMARDLRQQTAAAQASEQHFQALALATSDIVYRMSADWSLMYPLVGRALVASTDVPLERWAWLEQNVPADEHARVRQAIAEVVSNKALFSLEHRVRRPDGTLGWISSRAVPVLDVDGSVREWFGAASDITARKAAEAALAGSEAFARSVVGASADCMKGLTLDGRLMWMNDNGQRLMEVGDFAALQGSEWASLWESGGLRAQAEAALATARAGGIGRFTGFCPTAKGTPRWWDVAVTAIPGHDGLAEQLLAVSRDVTEQRAADDATRSVAARLQLALDCSGVVLFQQDMALRYTWIYNPALGFEASQVVGKLDTDLMERADEAEAVMALKQQVLQTGVGQRREVVIHYHGVAIFYRLLVEPLCDAGGALTGVTCAVIDITDLKLAEQALVDRDQQKDNFLATLAHELRNPLAPIKSGLELLARVGHEAPTRERLIGMMNRQLNQLVRLIDDLMEVSRIASGKLQLQRERVDLREIARLAAQECQQPFERAGHRLTLALPPGPMPVLGDAMRLVQAVSNLLRNACKYTDPGGHITLTVSGDGGDGAIGSARLAVQDDGLGIPAEMIERVFDIFTQVDRTLDRSQGGLGIGLALVRSLMRLHGGDVHAASAGPGLGSCFTLAMPQLPPAEDTAAPTPTPIPLPAGGVARSLKLLVVDDNVDAAQSLAMLLALDAHEVRLAHAGDQALVVAEGFRPDVVFCDLGLPGLAGVDVAQALRRQPHFAHTLLVALSGWGNADDRRRTREAGFDAHLTKPASRAALSALLRGVASADEGAGH